MESSLNKPGYHNTALIAKQLTHQVTRIIKHSFTTPLLYLIVE